MKRSVIMLGAGGHARVLLDALLAGGRHEVLGALVPDPGSADLGDFGVTILGTDEVLRRYPPDSVMLVNGVGSTGDAARRIDVYMRLATRGYGFESVIHPAATVSPRARLGAGAQVMAGVVVQTGCVLGDNVIVNTGARLDHDCIIGAHAHIAPGAVLCGDVQVMEGVHVGAGAVLIQGVRVGENAVVGAGSVVVSDVPVGVRVTGVPARELRSEA